MLNNIVLKGKQFVIIFPQVRHSCLVNIKSIKFFPFPVGYFGDKKNRPSLGRFRFRDLFIRQSLRSWIGLGLKTCFDHVKHAIKSNVNVYLFLFFVRVL